MSLLIASLAVSAVFLATPAGAASLNPSACAVAASDLASAIATNSSATTYSHQPTADGAPDVALVGGQWHPQPGEQIQFAIGRLIRPCN
jgi:hypothetical protein